MNIFKKHVFSTGCLVDPLDTRDRKYDEIALGAAPVDWVQGFDIEKKLNITIPIKNQGQSSSCVGQGTSYYVSVIDAKETGVYSDVSAKAIYSQIFLHNGGAYIRSGVKSIVDFGALAEELVPSYENGNPPSETFMRDKSWITDDIIRIAKILQAKEYRVISAAESMEIFAMAIRDNLGVVGGLMGENNKTWSTNEPMPPKKGEWGHCLYFGKYGTDSKGKWIATPNSWGLRSTDSDHIDGWQKLRENYFKPGLMFNPWTLVDKENITIVPEEKPMSEETKRFVQKNEKKIIIEGQGVGRKGIIIDGKLREIKEGREATACLYALANNELGATIPTKIFDEIEKDVNF